MQLEDIDEKFFDNKKFNKETEELMVKKSDLPEKLKKLGRNEGRVLRSQWIKLAITKWCHLDIKKKNLKNLNSDDFETIALAVKETLLATSKIKNIDRGIG